MARMAEVNSNVLLALTLWDGNTTKGCRARVYDSAGTEVAGSPFTLTHRSNGHYSGSGWNPTVEGQFTVSYEIYTDGTFVTSDVAYERGSEEVEVRSIDQDLATLTSRLTAGRASNLDNLDATISSRATQTSVNSIDTKLGTPAGASVSADIAAVKSDTSSTKTVVDTNLNATVASRSTQTSVDNINTKLGTPAGASVSADIAAVKSDTTSVKSTVDTNLNATVSSRATQTSVDAINTKLGTPAGASVSADIAAVKADTDTLTSRLTAGRASNLDNLDTTVSSRQSESSALTRYNQLINEHNDTQNTLSSVGSEVTAIKSKTDQLSFSGGRVESVISGTQEDTIVDKVWDEPKSAHNSADTFGDYLDAKVSSRQSESDALTRHNLNISEHDDTQSAIAGLNNLSSGDIQNAMTSQGYTPARANNLDNLDVVLSSRASQSSLNTAQSDISYIRSKSDETIGLLSDIESQLDVMETKIDNIILGIGSFDEEVFANAVWDKPRSENNLVGTFGQALQETVASRQSEATALVRHTENLDMHGITQTTIGANTVAIDDLSTKTTVDKNQIIGEINANEIKIDQVNTKVSGIQNNTDVIAVVPERMVPPESGSKPYQFVVETFNDSGVPVDADFLPTVRILTTAGMELVAETNMAKDGSKTGVYLYSYVINDAQVARLLRIEFKTIINGVTKYSQRTSEIMLFDSSLAQLEAKVDIIDNNVDDLLSLSTGANGFSQIKAKVQEAIDEVNANEVKLNQVKAKTDLIVSNPATTTDVTAIQNSLATKPGIADIQTRLDNQTSALKGPDNRNLTDVYDNERGTDNALLANDPRLNFLDAAISSRSSLTAAGVWSYVTRTLTSGAPLTNADAQTVWNVLTSSIGGVGTVGARIKDFLDIAVSSRSNIKLATLQSELAPLAKELTVSTIQASVVNECNENQTLLNQVISTLALIKPQTDKIIAGGATETTVITQADQNEALLNGLVNLVNLVKTRTDFIPNDVARQNTLLNIPTSPLLSTDPRLNNLSNLTRLDVLVSSRAASFPGDYATAAQVESAKNEIVNEVNANELKINALPQASFFDTRFAAILQELAAIEGSGFNSGEHSLKSNREKLNTINPGSTPQQIWNYNERHLSAYPPSVSPAQLDEATETIISNLTQYHAAMSTIIDQTGKQTFLVWLNLNGMTLANAENARVTVFDEAGAEVWSMAAAEPDDNGVFKMVRNNATQLLQPNKAYTARITIETASGDHSTVQPFFTLG